MTLAENTKRDLDAAHLPDLTGLCAGAADAANALLEKTTARVGDMVNEGGKLSAPALEREPSGCHGARHQVDGGGDLEEF